MSKTTTKNSAPTPSKAPTKLGPVSKKPRSKKTTPAKATPTKPTSSKKKPTTLTELTASFLDHLGSIGKSAGTVRSYASDLAVARKHFGDDFALAELSADQVTEFFGSDLVTKGRKGHPKSPITIAKILRVFRQALNYGTERRVWKDAPLP